MAKATTWLLLSAALAGCSAPMAGRAPESVPAPRAPSPNDPAFAEAMALTARLEYDAAIEKFGDLLPRLFREGRRDRIAETMFWLGYCYEKKQQYETAAKWYNRVASTYANTPPARQAADRLSRLPKPNVKP